MSTNYLRFLTTSQVKRLYDTHITRVQPTQPVYLESAVYSPQQHKNYGENDLFRLAGVLAEKIILNHAYQDGNKRVALLAADMFLKINGYQLQKKLFTSDELDQQLQSAHIAVATNQWDAEQLGAFYRSVATPIPRITSEIQRYIDKSEQS
ncbi:DOC family protein [Fusarium proliferatum]|nr:DOC family protein [Fusarium proliferatum]